MAFIESCIYYQDSKCILKGGCCDLDCGLTHSEKGSPFYDEIDTFTKWQLERTKQEDENLGRKTN
jgi:hypothetical protein